MAGDKDIGKSRSYGRRYYASIRDSIWDVDTRLVWRRKPRGKQTRGSTLDNRKQDR